jgi:predicted nucleic acid-binding protein
MCIVIDTNAFAKVFTTTNAEHDDFKPVLDWILRGKGKLILGGTQYEKIEIREKMPKYLGVLANLARAGKIHRVDTARVDSEAAKLEPFRTKDHDDPHIVALCIVSKTKVLCTGDDRSHSFVKDKRHYPKGQRPPKIYTNKAHTDLLTPDMLKPCC